MNSDDFKKTIVNFETNFSRLLIELLDKLSLYSTTDCEHQMMNMVSRLDHNGFYSEKQRKILANKGIYVSYATKKVNLVAKTSVKQC